MYVIKDKAREDSPRMPPCKISSINPIRNAENRPIIEGVIIVKNINGFARSTLNYSTKAGTISRGCPKMKLSIF